MYFNKSIDATFIMYLVRRIEKCLGYCFEQWKTEFYLMGLKDNKEGKEHFVGYAK